jgi:hypothetical protein
LLVVDYWVVANSQEVVQPTWAVAHHECPLLEYGSARTAQVIVTQRSTPVWPEQGGNNEHAQLDAAVDHPLNLAVASCLLPPG